MNQRQVKSSDLATNSSPNSKDQFGLLKNFLVDQYPIDEETIKSINTFEFDMSINNITAQQILDEIEAMLLNNEQFNIKEVIIKSFHKILQKKTTKKTHTANSKLLSTGQSNLEQITNFDHIKNLVPDKTFKNLDKELSNITPEKNLSLKIDEILSFNEKNNPIIHSSQLNTKEIDYNFYSDLEIKEYSFFPKDDYTYYEEYKNYFNTVKKDFMINLDIKDDDPLLNIEKFILLVAFDNNGDTKPIMSEIILVDPLQNYKTFSLKFENESKFVDLFFFPGQIVYVTGTQKANELIATNIQLGMSITQYSIAEKYIKTFFEQSAAYLIYVINGPILNKNDFDFTLFTNLLTTASNDNPHCLILNGPLLNVDNNSIMSGEIVINNKQMTYSQSFEYIINIISEIFTNKRTKIILCPNPSDVLNYYPLPQPSFNIRNSDNLYIVKNNKLKTIGNPQIFQLNEIIFAVANFDFVKDMIQQSVRGNERKSPLDASLEMILKQRSFYPILPSYVNSDEAEKIEKILTVDVRKLNHLYMKDIIPDIVITNSSMNYFVKKIASTVFVNPGAIFRNNNFGSFAKIYSYPPSVLYYLTF